MQYIAVCTANIALSSDFNGYHPLYTNYPFSLLCMAMCTFKSDCAGLGWGAGICVWCMCVCVCVGFAYRLTFTVSSNVS